MLLSKAMASVRAAEYVDLTWEQVNEKFKTMFFSGEEYDRGRRGAEQLSPVAAAHRILTNHFGLIPFGVYCKDGDARSAVADPYLDHVFRVRPNPVMSPFLCGKVIMSNAFWRGVGYCWNRRDGLGNIIERLPLPTECCVGVRKDPDTGIYWYDFSVDGAQLSLSSYELSILFFESYDGVRGRGLLDLARETIGADGAAQQYGRKFYQNGALISGIVEVDGDLGEPGREKIRKEFDAYSPYRENAFRVAVLNRGYKFSPMGVNQKEAQFIESRGFSVEEISRFTGIPKCMLQSGNESYDSNAQQRVNYVTDTLTPPVTQWEQENSYKALLRTQRDRGWYFKGNISVLLRGDDTTRSQFYQKMIQNGIYNPDECRALEERNPIPGGLGKAFLATKNLGSLESIVKGDA